MAKAIKILTIDDEDTVQSIIVAFLDRFLGSNNIPHEIKAFSDPLQGLFEISSHGESYHIILLDVRIPKITGDEIFNSLLHVNPDIASKVIFITAYPDDLAKRFSNMSLNIITKPFRYTSFCAKIVEVLKKK